MCKGYQLIFATLLLMMANLVSMEDKPCIARKEAAGYICVCNETYCDTIERPMPLKWGQYYHYMTSESSPGFTKTMGTFDNTTPTYQTLSNILSDVYIWLNTSVHYQTFSGLGASFTDSSGVVINTLSAGAKQNFIESYFGTSGLEYVFGRVPLGCSDFSLTVYSYDDVPGDIELNHFNLTKEDFILKIPIIKMALNASKRGLNLIATPWTAPSWMKTNNNSKPGYICFQFIHVWTKYILKFLEAYQKSGIKFWALSPGNEVIVPIYFGAFFAIPNVAMLPAQARYWTKTSLGPMLKKSDFNDIKILTLDDERPFMSWWASRMFADKEVAQYIDGIALHWYFDSNSSVPELDAFHNHYPDKPILYTESSINGFQAGGAAVILGEWSRALRYINNIFQNFQHWVSGYVDWNISLDEKGGPSGPAGMTLDASSIVNVTNGEFYKQPIFYALGHFSKFISPGSKRVQVTIKQDLSDDYYEENSDELLKERLWRNILRMNLGDSTTTASPFPTKKPTPSSNIVLALATVNPDGSHTVISYNPRSDPANLIIVDPEVGSFKKTVGAHSLNSFIYWPQKRNN